MGAFWLGVASTVAFGSLWLLVSEIRHSLKTGGIRAAYICPACKGMEYGPYMPVFLPRRLTLPLCVWLAKREHWKFYVDEAANYPSDKIAMAHWNGPHPLVDDDRGAR